MVSVMDNNNFELDTRKSDVVVVEYEPRTKPRVSEEDNAVVVSSNDAGVGETGISGCDVVDNSEEIRLSAVESETVRVCDVDVSGEDGRRRSGEVRVSEMDSKGTGDAKSELGDWNGGTEQLESSRVEKGRVNSSEEGGDAESTPRVIDDKSHVRDVKSKSPGSRVGNMHLEVQKSDVARLDSVPSMSDEFEASRSGGEMEVVGPSKPLGYGLEVGDMVWGKVKSHPWWPGQIFSEVFASNSVRRTKREGHVLVAFFGDSSYGWFELAELIPFAPNYDEKSKQTNSRTFVKAVEEAVDEVGRRCCLGLACRCRNPFNFRPTDVQGYFAVDVGDYEPGTVYSAKQIKEARDNFLPKDVLNFIKQLAVTPTSNEHANINFIKNKATALAYRKAVFEEFDETYAQAFGHQPVRPREPTQDMAQQLKVASRAPLSGPMVIAEALGKGKSSSKSNKAKDQSKKDRYLFKRRDELNELKTQGHPTPSAQPVRLDGSSAIVATDSVLQKRAEKPVVSKFSSGSHKQLDLDVGPISRDGSGTVNDDASTDHNMVEGFDQPPSQPAIVEIHGREQVQASDAKVQGDGSKLLSADGGAKKDKVRKRPVGELSAEKSVPPKKKKKRERESVGSDSKQTSASVVNVVARKPVQVSPVRKEDSQVDPQEDRPSNSSLIDSTGARQRHTEVELRQLLRDLHAIALNPFHGAERNPEVVRRVFSRFRFLVYQKSAAVLPSADDESNEPRPSKSSTVTAVHDGTPGDNFKPQKPQPPVRFDDPTKGGRKRALSDRQEEKVAKKKKFSDVKLLAAEKRTVQEKVARKENFVKPEFTKKSEPTPKVVDDPTMLVMKFPAGATLPSVNELKARFARFGPLDHSGTRVFWKTLTCRVIYKHKVHAEAACKFAAGSNNLFGNMNVKCYLRGIGVAGPEVESGKVQKEDSPVRAAPQLRPAASVAAQSTQQAGVQLKSCLKKSGSDEAVVPTGGGNGNGNGGGRGTPRVKFMLGGEDGGSKVEQLMMVGNKNNNNNASFADGGASSSSSSSTMMDFSSKNFQKVVPPPSLPILPPNIIRPPLLPNAQFSRPPPPLPNAQFIRPNNTPNAQFTIPPLPVPNAQFTRPPMQMQIPMSMPTPTNVQYTEIAPKNDHNVKNPSAGPSASSSGVNLEFEQQMMHLLTRCNEVVNGVKDLLGYMPYHPL
ncbi:hypothetical protein LguiA_007848 [Lonicera macranthoides]